MKVFFKRLAGVEGAVLHNARLMRYNLSREII